MSHPLTIQEAIIRLESGACFLLPNARAAAALRAAYNQRQSLTQQVWQPPNILSWDQFTSNLYSTLVVEGKDDRLLLNHAQEHSLWLEIVAAEDTALTSPDALATLAASAWSLAHAYRATPRLRTSAGSHDTRTFAAWAENFQRHCDRNKLLTAAELEANLEHHTHTVPPLTLCGLHDITPTQDSFLQSLEARGTKIEVVHLTTKAGAPTCPERSRTGLAFGDVGVPEPLKAHLTLPDEPSELRFAARYARHILEQDPAATIALLVPDPAAERPALEPILREILTPELQDIAADLSSLPWAFAANPPLANHPLIADALDLARWVRTALPLHRISALLLSPYLGETDHRDALARFDAQTLRRTTLLRPELSLNATLELARRHETLALDPQPSALLTPIAEAAANLLAGNPRRTYAEWTESLRRLLAAARWPGPRTLNAAETALTQTWDATLDLVATLDFAGRRVTFAEACDAIERQATQTPAPGPADTPAIQILTPAQAEGQLFTAALILRATDTNYPAAARPHPLLDWALQRDLGMPGADAATTTERTRQRLERLLTTTSTTLFSTALQNEDGPTRTSTLLTAFPLIKLTGKDLLPQEPHNPSTEILTLPDDTPIPTLPSVELSGGARLLQLQAACGFLAFAEMRLAARELDTQDPGFDALESGNILHRALDHFWTNTRSQSNLRAMSESERRDALTAAIDHATSRTHAGDSWDAAYLALQKDRMLRLLNKWLDHELERSPFTLQATEQTVPVTVGPLHLKLRMDRIDALDDGSGLVFVDYKTGVSAKPASWASDRPDEPQLPLYSLTLPDPDDLRGLAFARVRASEQMQWTGYAADQGILPKKGSKLVDLPSEIAQWHTILTQLAQDFHDGHTHVDPKSYPGTCARCAQRLLCRLDATTLMATSDEEPTDE